MYITLDELALAASTNTDVAELTAALATNNDFYSLSSYVEEDGYIDLNRVTNVLLGTTISKKEIDVVNQYDKLVEQYLGEGYKPLTLANIQVPDEFSMYQGTSATEEVRDLLIQNNTQHLELFAKNPDIPNLGNAFALIKEDGTSILNEAAIAKKIEFLEFIKTITPEEIQQNPLEVAKKVVFMFHESCKPLLATM